MFLPRALITLALPCLLSAQGEISPIFGGLTPGSGVALGVTSPTVTVPIGAMPPGDSDTVQVTVKR